MPGSGAPPVTRRPYRLPGPARLHSVHRDNVRSLYLGQSRWHVAVIPRPTAGANLKALRITDVSVLKGKAVILHAGGFRYELEILKARRGLPHRALPPPSGGGSE